MKSEEMKSYAIELLDKAKTQGITIKYIASNIHYGVSTLSHIRKSNVSDRVLIAIIDFLTPLICNV